jgi:hypothetical protein
MVKALGQVHGTAMTWPNTVVLSSGLWERDCAEIKAVYNKLIAFKVALRNTHVLCVTPAHFKDHPKIPHSFIGEAASCAKDARAAAIAAGQADAAPAIWDLGQVTEGVEDKDHLGHGGGFHYTSDEGVPTPVGRVVLAGWAAFVCQAPRTTSGPAAAASSTAKLLGPTAPAPSKIARLG